MNSKYYQDKTLDKVAVHRDTKHFSDYLWIYKHDWASPHAMKTTMALCKELYPDHWSKDVWPSNSPGLYPMDFSVW